MICTLHQDNEFIFEALNAGASGYILKDATGDEIKTAIKDLFLGGSPMSPYIARKIINVFREKEPLENQFGLSEREQEVLKLMSKGLLYKEIAAQLFISGNTVKNHLKNIYRKLHVQNKMEAVNKFKSK
jgi:DNA-binding NarL/FixJ family response regulator